jgi:lipoate-protein ligase A
MEKWRLILDPPAKGSRNMALDYALLLSVASGESSPFLRFYRWSVPTVTLGYFQDAGTEADISLCKSFGVDLIRRITGGGAVFHDQEITYSMVFPDTHHLAGKDILDSYSRTLAPFVDALSLYGLSAVHSPINDITVSGKKVSGSAQSRRKGCVLQHGTILLDLDRDKAFRCLTVPADKLARRGLSEPSQRVTTLRDVLGETVLSSSFEEQFIKTVTASFKSNHRITFEHSVETETELSFAGALQRNIFEQPNWNLLKEGDLP